MMLEQVKHKIDQIAATSSRKEKESILAEIKSSDIREAAEAVFTWAYEPTVSFYVDDLSDLPEPTGESSYDDLYPLLRALASRAISGNHAKQEISNYLNNVSPDERELVRRILKRDLRAGITATTINKVFDNLIYEHPYMRCSSLNSKTEDNLTFPALSQLKLDGMYVDIIVDKSLGKVIYMSRSGHVMPFNNTARDLQLLETVKHSTVIMGEALVTAENGEYEERSIGNGYLNSDDIDTSRIRFVCWDAVPLEDFRAGKCETPYIERIAGVEKVAYLVDDIILVRTVAVNSMDDIRNHFKAVRSEGQEGLVVKNYKTIWKDGTSKDQLKVKVVAEADLYITGWNPGEGKNQGLVGSVIARSSDDKVEVAISGFTDEMRRKITSAVDQLIVTSQIITIKFNDLVADENTDMLSLFLPRFVELRKDKHGKSEADSLNRIQHILENFELFSSV